MKIPKSKAKNAYELLSEVRALILAEPKRYNQGIWELHAIPGVVDRFDAPLGVPQCGTVACVAGWVNTLKPRNDQEYPDDAAMQTLGITSHQAGALFDADAFNGEPQTMAYARLGERHIARFQKRYEKRLKAKAV